MTHQSTCSEALAIGFVWLKLQMIGFPFMLGWKSLHVG